MPPDSIAPDSIAPDSIALPGGIAPLTWRRSARARRISLRIEPRAGGVIVPLPARASIAAGRAVLLTYRDWIVERLERLPAPVALGDGATVMLDGTPRRIVHRPEARGTAWLEDDDIHVAGERDFVGRRVNDWLRLRARRQLGQLAREKAQGADLALRRVTIRDTSSRWGSCTSSGNLMFSWRLVMAPRPVQDYVVGHEVAHLRYMNHSSAFWALTDQLTPHREAAHRWLSAHGAGLMRIG